MKILLINQTFYPDPAATAQYLTDLARALVSSGHQVTVLTGRKNYLDASTRHPSKEIHEGIQILRVGGMITGSRSKLIRILEALWMNLAFTGKLLSLSGYDRIVGMTSPPMMAWAASLIAVWRKTPFVYWVMDINPDEAIEAKWIQKGSMQAHILEWILKNTLKRCQKVIVLDHFMKDRLILKGANPSRIEIISPWSHDEDLETISHDQNIFRKQNGLENKFVVMYSGNHSICHPLNTLLQAAYELKENQNIMFVFIGGGERVKDVAEFKIKHRLSNILQFPYQERKSLSHSLSAADIHVVVMGDPYVGIVHPCKLYGILKIGRPFVYIGPEKSHIAEIIEAGHVGYAVRHGEVSKLAHFFEEVKNLSVDMKEDISAHEKMAVQKYQSQTLISRWIKILIHS